MAKIATTGDQWKEIAAYAKNTNMKTGASVETVIARVNEIWPFSKASGILDNGCGTGQIISHILDNHGKEIPASTEIIASDFSEHMLAVLRSKQEANADVDGWQNLNLLNLDAHDLSAITDESLSLVTGGHVYFLLEDFRKALQETRRVLCPRGVFAMTSGYQADHMYALQDAIDLIKPGTNAVFVREPWNSMVGVEELLLECGFKDVEMSLTSTDMQYDTHEQFAKILVQMPIMKNLIELWDDGEKDRLSKEIVVQLCRRNPAAPGSLQMTSIIAIARRA